MFTTTLVVVMAVLGFQNGAATATRTEQPAGSRLEQLERRVRGLRHKLEQPVGVEAGAMDNVPLKDVLEFFGQRHEVLILVDKAAFRDETGGEDVDQAPIRLPKIVNLPLAAALRMAVSQVHGAVRVLPTYVEITTPRRLRPEDWTKGDRAAVPAVDLELTQRPLAEALREVALTTGVNVVLDQRVPEAAKMTVTAALHDVPLDTAVSLLADMCGLKTVAVDSVLYVASPEVADGFREELKAHRPKGKSPPPPAPVGM